MDGNGDVQGSKLKLYATYKTTARQVLTENFVPLCDILVDSSDEKGVDETWWN